MIKSIFIQNFKAYSRNTIKIYNHNIVVGENDSGKTTILEALDIFFNDAKINKSFVRDQRGDVRIGVTITNTNDSSISYLEKTFSPATYKEDESKRRGDFSIIEEIKYIYLKAGNNDPLTIVKDLATARVLEKTSSTILDTIKSVSQAALDEVLSDIDEELMVVANDHGTEIIGTETFKYEAGIKFDLKCNEVPVEARGLGFQKNLVYALLTGTQYNNVILGIDEVENSISLNSTNKLLQKIQDKFAQTIVTTHSKKVVEVKALAEIIPIYNEDVETLSELLLSLDSQGEDMPYLLLEGKFDLPWYKKALTILGKANDYIIIPSGGEGNIEALKTALEARGKTTFYIKDGDVGDGNACLSKECVELYTPVDALNEILNINLTECPNTKETFFTDPIVTDDNNEDAVKEKLSSKATEFLDSGNPFVSEIKLILEI